MHSPCGGRVGRCFLVSGIARPTWAPSSRAGELRRTVEYRVVMTTRLDRRNAGDRLSTQGTATAVWLYFWCPFSPRMVEELRAAHGGIISHETLRQRGLKYGREIEDGVRRCPSCCRWTRPRKWTRSAGARSRPEPASNERRPSRQILTRSTLSSRTFLVESGCYTTRMGTIDASPS